MWVIIMEIYYESQNGWGEDEYYYLHRVLHRMFYYYDRYSEEIRNIDTSRMSEETKVLIYCIVKYYHNEFLFEQFSNLKEISYALPLNEMLVLTEHPLPEHTVYNDMNVRI